MINGIINVYKETGYTSHDVVARLRGILRQKKIGHTGTLDPDAGGVLPVCLGKATKLCDMIGDWDKSYQAVLLLGRTTDTEDTSGKILSNARVETDQSEICDIIRSFEGPYDQIPPMYSAKKRNGKRLYELAREGIVIDREPCPVHIHSIEIIDVDLPRVTFCVTCSKGTYIRSLCRDIGEKAGCGGCMEDLVRTRVRDFTLSDSHSLEDIEHAADADRLDKWILPVDSLFKDHPEIKTMEKTKKLLMNGNPIPVSDLPQCPAADFYRVYDPDGHFIGLYKKNTHKMRIEPYKLFFDF